MAYEVFVHIAPKPDACEHDFKGWRAFADGNGGEQVCAKCGLGAQAYTLMIDEGWNWPTKGKSDA